MLTIVNVPSLVKKLLLARKNFIGTNLEMEKIINSDYTLFIDKQKINQGTIVKYRYLGEISFGRFQYYTLNCNNENEGLAVVVTNGNFYYVLPGDIIKAGDGNN